MNEPGLRLRNKLLVVCGPTATGKTSLGVYLAKKFEGEIVSADSRQIYIGMDIATGKDLPVNAKLKIKDEKLQIKTEKGQILKPYRFDGIPVWMLDIVRPNQEFSAAQYIELAEKVIEDIWHRGKLPIVIGGTGFYIKALVDGVKTLGVPPDWQLRRKLEKKAVEELFEILCRLNSGRAASMNASDRRNPRRLIRAIEIGLKLKGHNGEHEAATKAFSSEPLLIGLTAAYGILYQRVDRRIEEQAGQGAEKEIRTLLEQGYNWDLPAMTAMGYGVCQPYFEGRQTKEEVIRKWQFEEHAYIRRQMTWFKRDKRVSWFDITRKAWSKKVEELVRSWYNHP